MLEGGRPCTSVSKDHSCSFIGKSNCAENGDQFSEKVVLERQLKEAIEKQRDAMAKAMKMAERNEELENQLRKAERMTLAAEADCNSTVRENNKRICKLQVNKNKNENFKFS